MRRILHENVRLIMEELQGANAQAQQPGMPTPGKPQQPAVKPVPGKNNPAQQVVAGVQGVANTAAAQAANAGDAKLQAQMAQQQGLDPAHAAQVSKTANAQPQPTRANPTALARDRRNDNLVNKQQAQAGNVVQPVEGTFDDLDKLMVEDKVTDKSAAEDGSNPDETDGFNDNPAAKRAKERAKEIDTKAAGDKADFPGEKKDHKAAGWGKEGAGRPQGHHEVTKNNQRMPRSTEKGEEGVKEEVAETVYTDAERTALLDGIFGS